MEEEEETSEIHPGTTSLEAEAETLEPEFQEEEQLEETAELALEGQDEAAELEAQQAAQHEAEAIARDEAQLAAEPAKPVRRGAAAAAAVQAAPAARAAPSAGRGQVQPAKPAARTTRVEAPATKELAVRKTLDVAQAGARPSRGQALKGDLIVEKVLLMQAISKLVKERKANAGEIVRSPGGQVLGGIGGPGEVPTAFYVLPLAILNSWSIMTEKGSQWVRREERTLDNEALGFQFTEDGVDLKRYRTIDLICLLESDLANKASGVEVDEDGIPLTLEGLNVMPVAISFKASSYLKGGKVVATHFHKIAASQKDGYPHMRPYHFMLPISCTEEANDLGDYFVFDVGGSVPSQKADRETAAGWYDTVMNENVSVADEGEAEAKAAEKMEARPAPRGAARY